MLSTSSSPNLVIKNRKQQRPPSRCQTISQFDRLPDNCVIKILSYLSSNQLVKCSRISRRFYFLAWEPELWSDIVLEGGFQIDADLALKTIIRLLSRNAGLPNKQHSLNSLILNGCQRLTDRGLAIVARRCPHLTKLEIQYCTNITNGGLMDLVTKCPMLDHLDVTGRKMLHFFFPSIWFDKISLWKIKGILIYFCKLIHCSYGGYNNFRNGG